MSSLEEFLRSHFNGEVAARLALEIEDLQVRITAIEDKTGINKTEAADAPSK